MNNSAELEPSEPIMCLVVALDGCGLLFWGRFRIYNGLRQKELEALVLLHNSTPPLEYKCLGPPAERSQH